MKFVFERNSVNGNDYYRIKKSEACNCLKSLNMVVVGREYDQNNHGDRSCGVFIERCETVQSWGDEWENVYYYKINCCPICKKEIVVDVIEGKDYTEDYKKLESERDEVLKKAMRCDSKKRTEELLKKRNELDRQLESFFDEELWLHPDKDDD